MYIKSMYNKNNKSKLTFNKIDKFLRGYKNGTKKNGP